MTITVRPAQPSDAQRIWEIRNSPEALAVASSPEIVPLAQHINWFNSKYFANKGNVCFVAEIDNNIIGYSRFDFDTTNNQYINSIAIDPSMHGQGVATLLLSQSVQQLNSERPIHAEVRKFNIVSQKLFERCGFTKKSEDDKNIYYQFI